ncbi:DUF3602 domain-containing protein [Aspergillus affinis]|uniref:DUF3602 domain-containing protein n=1 Tax=Aspergillus affinis TaxID=1070780 RepID=UPI0022FE474D|nr:uncharacterized protein KD926_010866 [Aspergillus affinis]KAI9038330.1 hypothetical protein KD926_010866 [Aspergillus affinis]
MGGSRNISHGRGGAGNIYSAETRTSPKDLVTPTIKQEVFTTGRGGSGNMVVNDPQHPEIAREMQDVESPPLRVEDAPHHTGRGGAANAFIPTAEEEKKVREQEEEQLRRIRTASRDRLREETERRDGSEKRAESSSS